MSLKWIQVLYLSATAFLLYFSYIKKQKQYSPLVFFFFTV